MGILTSIFCVYVLMVEGPNFNMSRLSYVVLMLSWYKGEVVPSYSYSKHIDLHGLYSLGSNDSRRSASSHTEAGWEPSVLRHESGVLGRVEACALHGSTCSIHDVSVQVDSHPINFLLVYRT